ncbi:MAG: MFS transporter [Anaerolineae bacterium]|nr:MFS transporter [Anaerolineae bacterium]
MSEQTSHKLPWLTKVIYGSGDWSMAAFNTIRQFFYAIFLTDVVGLDPRLASFAALMGVLWDAVNDPLIGMLSDKVQSRWGRRRPFLLLFAVPFGLGFVLLWWAPSWQNQILLMIHVMLTYMISDTLQTLVVVPFHALTPEVTSDYDERTQLTAYRMFFNLVASLATAVSAPMMVDAALAAGNTAQQGYMLVAAIFGSSAILPYLAIFFVVRERETTDHPSQGITFRKTLRTAWENIPFRYAAALYMLNWVAFDLMSNMLPFFLTYWIASGDLLATFAPLNMPLESVVLGAVLVVALALLPFWTWLSGRIGKRVAYIISMTLGVILFFAMFTVQPGQITFGLILSILIGISASAAHVLPDAIFPDVIDWDELRVGFRHEGVYYGAKNFLRKLTGAIAIFIALQVLGWLGYQAPPEGATQFSQPLAALWGIRILTCGLTGVILLGATATAWFYPLNRARYNRIQRLLARRQRRRLQRALRYPARSKI